MNKAEIHRRVLEMAQYDGKFVEPYSDTVIFRAQVYGDCSSPKIMLTPINRTNTYLETSFSWKELKANPVRILSETEVVLKALIIPEMGQPRTKHPLYISRTLIKLVKETNETGRLSD